MMKKYAGIGGVLTILIIAFAVYYFVHVQRKTAYFAARNLRVLATVTAQLEENIRQPDVVEGVGISAPLQWDAAARLFRGSGDPLPPEAVFRPVFEQSFVNVFDAVIVADAKGGVLWRHPKSVCSITRMDQLTERKDFRTTGTIALAQLQHRAQNRKVELEGRDYHLFTQPLALGGETWIVAGVVSTTRFTGDSVTISYTLLISVLAAFLLILFTLPFLKLSLLGELQRVRLSDIILLGVSLLCATAILTLVLLDIVAYRRTRSVSDAQLRRLASDVRRHVRAEVELAYAAMTKLEEKLASGAPSIGKVPEELRYDPDIRAYPFFHSFARIGADGMQRQKWLMDSRPIGVVPVHDRTYFRAAVEGQEWAGARGARYVLAALRSRTTGTTEAVIAKRAAPVPPYVDAAVSLSFPMLSLIDTVVAGDCQFVVIDDKGDVVFHSESQRNNLENFFVETDQNKALRSAVAGRQNEMINLRYWGEDHRGFTTPLDGTPWTLVTFRNKRLLRTLNVETIMITVMFLLIYALGYAIFAAIVALFAPTYRAPWLWPDRNRGAEYRQLLYAYLAFCAAFILSIYLLRPRGVLVVAGALPALVLLLTYLRLQRRRGVARVAAYALAAGAALTFLATVITGVAETDVLLPTAFVRVAIVLLTAGGVLLAIVEGRRSRLPFDLPFEDRRDRLPFEDRRDRLSSTLWRDSRTQQALLRYSYVLAGAGLLALSAIFPTAALYKAAFKIETESFVKHGQLELVHDLEARRRALDAFQSRAPWRSPEVTELRKSSGLGVYYRFFLNTEVFVAPNATDHVVAALEPGALDPRLDATSEERNPVPRFVEWLLPQYSDHSVRMRELLHSASADDRWTWNRRGDQLDFFSRSIHGMNLITTSGVPRLWPRFWFRRDAEPLPLRRLIEADHPNYADVRWDSDAVSDATRRGLTLIILGVYGLMLVWVVRFVAQRVFLEDLREPAGCTLYFAATPEAGLKEARREDDVEISIAAVIADPRVIDSTLAAHPAQRLLIPDFDHGLGDAAVTKVKLALLEVVAERQAREIAAVTTVSPSLLLASGDAQLDDRWRALLSRFVVQIVDAPAGEGEAPLTALINGSPDHAEELIRRESDVHDPVVRSLGRGMRALRVHGREELYDELSERAERYYASIWAACTREEKLVLMHVAADGFANPKDRQVLRRLMARRLIRRGPNFTVMNETFRRFVLAPARRRECTAFDEDVPVSAWDRIQKPLIAGLVVAGGFVFFTQREMFDASLAIVGGVAGGIPAILRIAGFFMERDPGAVAKA